MHESSVQAFASSQIFITLIHSPPTQMSVVQVFPSSQGMGSLWQTPSSWSHQSDVQSSPSSQFFTVYVQLPPEQMPVVHKFTLSHGLPQQGSVDPAHGSGGGPPPPPPPPQQAAVIAWTSCSRFVLVDGVRGVLSSMRSRVESLVLAG